VLDEEPALDAELVELCLWIADYYDAPPGEVLRAALPPGTAEGWSARLVLSERGRAVLDGAVECGALPRAARHLLAALARAGGGRRRVGGADGAGLIAAGLAELADERGGRRARVRTVAHARLLRAPTEDEARWIARAPRRAAVVAALGTAAKPVAALGVKGA